MMQKTITVHFFWDFNNWIINILKLIDKKNWVLWWLNKYLWDRKFNLTYFEYRFYNLVHPEYFKGKDVEFVKYADYFELRFDHFVFSSNHRKYSILYWKVLDSMLFTRKFMNSMNQELPAVIERYINLRDDFDRSGKYYNEQKIGWRYLCYTRLIDVREYLNLLFLACSYNFCHRYTDKLVDYVVMGYEAPDVCKNLKIGGNLLCSIRGTQLMLTLQKINAIGAKNVYYITDKDWTRKRSLATFKKALSAQWIKFIIHPERESIDFKFEKSVYIFEPLVWQGQWQRINYSKNCYIKILEDIDWKSRAFVA